MSAAVTPIIMGIFIFHRKGGQQPRSYSNNLNKYHSISPLSTAEEYERFFGSATVLTPISLPFLDV